MKTACLLITHLPLKAELRRRPELRGRPVLIYQSHGSRRTVLDRSPEARGVRPGTTLPEALARCPDATLLEADAPHYRAVLHRVVQALEGRSPAVEVSFPGCAYVGLEGLEAMYGGEAGLTASLLQAAPPDLHPRLGIGEGKFPAYAAAASCRGGQAFRVPEDAAGFLEGFSVDLLPLTPEDRERLRRFGLGTLGQVARLPAGAVQAQLGPAGRRTWELSQGIDHTPLVPHQPEETITESLTFPSPAVTRQALLAGVDALLGRAFARRELRGRYVRKVSLEGRVHRRPPWTREIAFKEPAGRKEKALAVVKGLLETASLPGPLEDLTLTLSGLTGETGRQESLFPEARRREQLREAVRSLEVQLGRRPPLYQVKDVEPWSRIPERRRGLVPFSP